MGARWQCGLLAGTLALLVTAACGDEGGGPDDATGGMSATGGAGATGGSVASGGAATGGAASGGAGASGGSTTGGTGGGSSLSLEQLCDAWCARSVGCELDPHPDCPGECAWYSEYCADRMRPYVECVLATPDSAWYCEEGYSQPQTGTCLTELMAFGPCIDEHPYPK